MDPNAAIEPPTAYDYRVPSAATIDKKSVDVDVSQWIANPSGTANELKVGVHPPPALTLTSGAASIRPPSPST